MPVEVCSEHCGQWSGAWNGNIVYRVEPSDVLAHFDIAKGEHVCSSFFMSEQTSELKLSHSPVALSLNRKLVSRSTRKVAFRLEG